MSNPLPFQPETIEQIKARWSLALVGVYDQQLCANGDQIAPGAQRRHVFDFEDGLRVVASVDRIVHGRAGGRHSDELHLSFGMYRPIGNFMERAQEVISMFVNQRPLTMFKTDRATHFWFELPTEVVA